jgi:hypothetical protein
VAFFVRKSFRAGPARLNLSKSGLGASVGVKGARLGVSSRGRAYVSGGHGGLYYRRHLTGGTTTGSTPRRRSPRPGSALVIEEDTRATFAPKLPSAGSAVSLRFPVATRRLKHDAEVRTQQPCAVVGAPTPVRAPPEQNRSRPRASRGSGRR